MKIPEKTLYLVLIILLITVGALGWFLKKQTRTIIETQNIITALTDTVEIGRNDLGQQQAKIQNLETARAKDLLKIKSQDATIKWLQSSVERNENRLGAKGSVTVFDSKTSFVAKNPTTVIPKDTVLLVSENPNTPDTLKLYPEYRAIINLGKWINGNTRATKDSTTVALKIINEYELVIGEEPIPGTGFLGIGKKQKSFSEVTNLNPYSETSVIRTYKVLDGRKQKKFSVGPQVNYTPFGSGNHLSIGVGIQYNLLNLF